MLSFMITSPPTWKISFYDDKVERETLRLPPGILANFLRIVELIEQFGPAIGRPIVLITVIKKGRRIPARHMDTARRRMKEIQEIG